MWNDELQTRLALAPKFSRHSNFKSSSCLQIARQSSSWMPRIDGLLVDRLIGSRTASYWTRSTWQFHQFLLDVDFNLFCVVVSQEKWFFALKYSQNHQNSAKTYIRRKQARKKSGKKTPSVGNPFCMLFANLFYFNIFAPNTFNQNYIHLLSY